MRFEKISSITIISVTKAICNFPFFFTFLFIHIGFDVFWININRNIMPRSTRGNAKLPCFYDLSSILSLIYNWSKGIIILFIKFNYMKPITSITKHFFSFYLDLDLWPSWNMPILHHFCSSLFYLRVLSSCDN